MGKFSACLSEVVPIIGLKGCARVGDAFSAGKKCWLLARRTGQICNLRQLLIAAFVSAIASCSSTYATTSQQANSEPNSARPSTVGATCQVSLFNNEGPDQDCFAIGDNREREACFAKLSRTEIVRCEQMHLYACAPYKTMHSAENRIVGLEEKIENLAMRTYGHGKVGDSEYAELSTQSFKATNNAWRSCRDSVCVSEQYIAGTNRGREFGDIVEACRLEMTEARIKKLTEYLSSFEPFENSKAELKNKSDMRYPEAIRGSWMPQSMGCIQAANGGLYEGEALITITSEMLGQYENTSRPLQVEQISEKPASWRITSEFSPGTGEYEGKKALVFTLNAGTLLIDAGSHTAAYTKCEYNNN